MLGMRIPHPVAQFLGGESASVMFCFALRLASLPSPGMFDPFALRGGEDQYRAQESRSHRECQKCFYYGDDSNHR